MARPRAWQFVLHTWFSQSRLDNRLPLPIPRLTRIPLDSIRAGRAQVWRRSHAHARSSRMISKPGRITGSFPQLQSGENLWKNRQLTGGFPGSGENLWKNRRLTGGIPTRFLTRDRRRRFAYGGGEARASRKVDRTDKLHRRCEDLNRHCANNLDPRDAHQAPRRLVPERARTESPLQLPDLHFEICKLL